MIWKKKILAEKRQPGRSHTILQIRCGPPVSWGIGRIVGEGRVVLQALKSLQGCARAYRLCWELRRGDRKS